MAPALDSNSETPTEKKSAGAIVHIKPPEADHYFKALELVAPLKKGTSSGVAMSIEKTPNEKVKELADLNLKGYKVKCEGD